VWPSVVVITSNRDLTADSVILELKKMNVSVARMDLSDVPDRVRQVSLLSTRKGWNGSLSTEYWNVDLSHVRSVWWRKPSAFAPDTRMTTTEKLWCSAESEMGFCGTLGALPGVHWVNHPQRSKQADMKPVQLAIAARCGLAVPDSLLTNDPDQAREFCQKNPEGVVYKPMQGGPGRIDGSPVVLRTTEVSESDINNRVMKCIHLFQARVPCGYSVRMTVIGQRIFAVRLDTPPDVIDWRAVPERDIIYTPGQVPDDVAEGTHRMMKHFGLVYSAPDWVVTPAGDWVFIGDLNPNGQWGWIAHRTKLPIAATLAHELTRGLS